MFSKLGVVLFVGGAGANGFGSMADRERINLSAIASVSVRTEIN